MRRSVSVLLVRGGVELSLPEDLSEGLSEDLPLRGARGTLLFEFDESDRTGGAMLVPHGLPTRTWLLFDRGVRGGEDWLISVRSGVFNRCSPWCAPRRLRG